MGVKWYKTVTFLLVLLLCGCSGREPQLQSTFQTIPEVTATDDLDTMQASATIETESTNVYHSELYLPDYTPQQILEYFEEVVLDMEYSDGTGDPGLVQKWLVPICYRIYGNPTEEDRLVLLNLFDQLNGIYGFPGIRAVEEGAMENLSIRFLEPDAFDEEFSYVIHGEQAYGAVQFWYYTDSNELHTGRIGYRTDIDQKTRNSVLIEEIINTLGISDTILRPDSVVYQYSNENTVLSDVDLIILKLLYHPSLGCGMDAEHCAEILEELYF